MGAETADACRQAVASLAAGCNVAAKSVDGPGRCRVRLSGSVASVNTLPKGNAAGNWQEVDVRAGYTPRAAILGGVSLTVC